MYKAFLIKYAEIASNKAIGTRYEAHLSIILAIGALFFSAS